MAFSPDAEIKEEVLVELLQKWAVAIAENLLQQQLAGHQHVHVYHAARDLQRKTQINVCPEVFSSFRVCIYTTVAPPPPHRRFDTTAPVMWLLGQSFLTGCSTLTPSRSTHPARRKRSNTNAILDRLKAPKTICFSMENNIICLQTWLSERESFLKANCTILLHHFLRFPRLLYDM